MADSPYVQYMKAELAREITHVLGPAAPVMYEILGIPKDWASPPPEPQDQAHGD